MPQAIIKRAFTGDRGPPGSGERMTIDILTNEQLGPKMSKLPNGSLLCRDVPIARVGWMMYGRGETPVAVGPNGIAYVERTADDLFDPDTIGSFMAATVVDEHPQGGEVIPSNWKNLAKGFTTTNVRRGTGDDADVLLADLVITDAALIASVLAGKREVSCGYEANYFQTGPGLGRQTGILGNHIALVEKGRCGPRCSIGDRASPTHEGKSMTKRVALKTVRRAVVDTATLDAARQRVNDAQAELDEMEEGEDAEDSVHVHIHTADAAGGAGGAPAKTADDARFVAIEKTVGELTTAVKELATKLTAVPAVTADGACPECAKLSATAGEKKMCPACEKAKKTADAALEDLDPQTGKTMDSAALATSFNSVMAQAEVLVPGFRMPTFDAAAKRRVTVDAMCGARRKCLELAYATKDGQALIEGIGGPLDLEKLDCAATAILFSAAATTKGAMNNRASTGDSKSVANNTTEQPKKPLTFADINAANKKYWDAHSPQPA